MKIVTRFSMGPLPWCAVTENYDAELDNGEWVSSHPVGYGKTEQAAIEDLKQQLEDSV